MAAVDHRPRRSLLHHPDFVRFWTAQAVSEFGSQITYLAIPIIAATALKVSAFEFSLLAMLETAPFVVLSLPAGVWVDRLRRRPILIGMDLGRAVMLLSIPLAFAFNALTIWHLYLVALVTGSMTVVFWSAYQAYLPSIVDPEQLVEGNSKLETSSSAAQIAGPSIAGVLIGVVRAPFAIVLDALSFVFSAGCVFLIRRPEPPVAASAEPTTSPSSLRSEIVEGIRYVAGHPWLRSIAATLGIAYFFGSITGSILVLYLVRDGAFTPVLVGVAFSIGSVGVLAAALVTDRVTRRLGVGRSLVLAAVGLSVFYAGLPVALADGGALFAAVAVYGFGAGFFNTAWNINQISLRQAITPPRMQGRMNATIRFFIFGMIPVGSIIGGVLGSLVGLRPTIMIAAAGGLVAFVPVVLSTVRDIGAMPTPNTVLGNPESEPVVTS